VNFIDITDHHDVIQQIKVVNVEPVNFKYPAQPSLQSTIKPLLKQLKTKTMRENLVKFSSFQNRYYTSKYGKESADWLASKIDQMIKESGADKTGVVMRRFSHSDPANWNKDVSAYEDGPPPTAKDRKNWNQTSIIVTIPGKSNKTIVIGAHQDSINIRDIFTRIEERRAPGADDDGSGAITILEALRVLLQSDDVRKGNAPNTVDFHWYSAEEAGLLGSVDVFSKYSSEGRDVRAMLQQDMTGYIKGTLARGKPEALGVITDFVNVGLTNFIKKVITDYCDIPYVNTKCGYACSDHASAEKFHYPGAFVIESAMEDAADYIHSKEDTVDKVSFEHMLQHAKLSLGLAYELAYADLPKITAATKPSQ
jgi:bacterial leucyl aminopeptidase